MFVLAIDGAPKRYPYSVADLKKDNPNVSFPEPLADDVLATWDVFPVQLVNPIYDSATQNVTELEPILQNGKWLQAWDVTEASPGEIAERTATQGANVRADRNRRLSECDWTQLPDAPVDHAAWAAYRQALRDVSSQPGFPWNVQWPVVPS